MPTEAANAALATAFGAVGLDETVSFTTTGNLRSQLVMQRIGMTRNPSEEFDHRRVADGPLRRHVLYRISRVDWETARAEAATPAPSLGLAPPRQHNP